MPTWDEILDESIIANQKLVDMCKTLLQEKDDKIEQLHQELRVKNRLIDCFTFAVYELRQQIIDDILKGI